MRLSLSACGRLREFDDAFCVSGVGGGLFVPVRGDFDRGMPDGAPLCDCETLALDNCDGWSALCGGGTSSLSVSLMGGRRRPGEGSERTFLRDLDALVFEGREDRRSASGEEDFSL